MPPYLKVGTNPLKHLVVISPTLKQTLHLEFHFCIHVPTTVDHSSSGNSGFLADGANSSVGIPHGRVFELLGKLRSQSIQRRLLQEILTLFNFIFHEHESLDKVPGLI